MENKKSLRKLSFYAEPLIAFIMALCCYIYVVTQNPLTPGVWISSSLFLTSALMLMLCFVVMAIGNAFYRRIPWLGCAFLFIVIIFLGIKITTPRRNLAELATKRFQVERNEYLKAINSGSIFHDQSSEVKNGRLLTYWRWGQVGYDNAIGLIYDPKDELMKNKEDKLAFQKKTTGVIVRVHRIEANWYAVWHT